MMLQMAELPVALWRSSLAPEVLEVVKPSGCRILLEELLARVEVEVRVE